MSCDIEDTCVCLQPCSEQALCRTCADCTPMDFDENDVTEDERPEGWGG